jgi:hypothetical protein
MSFDVHPMTLRISLKISAVSTAVDERADCFLILFLGLYEM